MEKHLSIGHQKVWFDEEATVELYRRTITTPGANSCSCISCRNFAVQRSKIFSDEFAQFLGKLGIDPNKEWEAFDLDFDRNENGHLYGGWFVFVGGLVDGFDERPAAPQQPFAYRFTNSFPTGRLPNGVRFCAVEFLVRIPWVLSETPS